MIQLSKLKNCIILSICNSLTKIAVCIFLLHACTVSFVWSGVLESPFAINAICYFHLREDPKVWEIGEWRAKFVKDLGASFDRSDFWWAVIEPEKNKFSWAFPDKVVAEFKRHGFNIFPILNYFSAWSNCTAPNTDEERELFARYVYLVVSRYKKDIKYWEVWNEPNLAQFWAPLPDPENYTKLLRVTYKAAKAADPSCKIVAPAIAGLDMPFLEAMYKHGAKGYYDIFSYHYYSTEPPEKNRWLEKDLQKIHDFLKKQGDLKPIWITEMGVTSIAAPGGVSEKIQADYLVRNYLICLSTGYVERIFWFCLLDWVQDTQAPPWDAHLGLLRFNGEPKPAYAAYKTMVSKLSGKKFAGEIKVKPHIFAYLFIPHDHLNQTTTRYPTLVCWTDKGKEKFSIYTNNKKPTALTITEINGISREIIVNKRNIAISCSESPMYLEGDISIMHLLSQITIQPRLLQTQPAKKTESYIEIYNPFSEPLEGVFRIKLPKGWKIDFNEFRFSILPSCSTTFKFNFIPSPKVKEGEYKIWLVSRFTNKGLPIFKTFREVEILRSETVKQ